MSCSRPDRRIRPYVVGLLFAFLLVSTAACSTLERLLPGQDQEEVQPATVAVGHGPCLPTLGDEVYSVALSRDGGTLMYLSATSPANLPEGQGWTDDARAVYVVRQQQSAEGEMISATHAIVLPWESDATDTLAGVTFDDYGRPVTSDELGNPVTAEPSILAERMSDLMLAATGDRFVLSVARRGVQSGWAKLYTGIVPPDDSVLAPPEGLSVVPINQYELTEGVLTYILAPDGSKVAATVGALGELRVYDFAAGLPTVYSLDDDGAVALSNELPDPPNSLDITRQPAFTFPGTVHFAWSPDATRLAISRTDSVGVGGVWVLDVTTGKAFLVRSFRDTTVPYVAWSSDGASLFVLTTDITSTAGSAFGNSEVRRIAAKEGGADVGDRWQLMQQNWYRTAPGDFTAFGDDVRFVFTWEKQVWLLQTPAAGKGEASYGPLTLQVPDMSAYAGNLIGLLSVAPDADTVAFKVDDSTGSHAGQRLYVSAETCPLSPTPEPGEPAAEGVEGEGAAPAEGGQEVPAEGAPTAEGEGAAPTEEAEESEGAATVAATAAPTP